VCGGDGTEPDRLAPLGPASACRRFRAMSGTMTTKAASTMDQQFVGVIDVRRRLVMLLHIGREPGLELAHQRAEARHDGDRLEQRP
jgi:hypothetical protein